MSSLLAARLRLGELEEILGEWCADFGKDTKTVRRLARLGGTPEEKAESAACDRLYEVLKKTRRDFVKGIAPRAAPDTDFTL